MTLRPIRLARIAAEAESLRLRKQAQRTVVRLAFALVALVFAGMAAAFCHVAIWFALRFDAGLPPWATALVLAALDLLAALIFLLIAALKGPGQVEREALQVRRRALENAASTAAVSTLVIPAVRAGIGLLRK